MRRVPPGSGAGPPRPHFGSPSSFAPWRFWPPPPPPPPAKSFFGAVGDQVQGGWAWADRRRRRTNSSTPPVGRDLISQTLTGQRPGQALAQSLLRSLRARCSGNMRGLSGEASRTRKQHEISRARPDRRRSSRDPVRPVVSGSDGACQDSITPGVLTDLQSGQGAAAVQ